MSMAEFREAAYVYQMLACGLHPGDREMMWWKGLPDADREELFRLSNESRGKMPTLTGVGVDAQQISARRLPRPNHRSKKRDD